MSKVSGSGGTDVILQLKLDVFCCGAHNYWAVKKRENNLGIKAECSFKAMGLVPKSYSDGFSQRAPSL